MTAGMRTNVMFVHSPTSITLEKINSKRARATRPVVPNIANFDCIRTTRIRRSRRSEDKRIPLASVSVNNIAIQPFTTAYV